MSVENGQDPFDQLDHKNIEEHGERDRVDAALWSMLLEVMSDEKIGGFRGFVEDLAAPEVSTEDKEAYARAVMERVLHKGIAKGQLMAQGNPENDPDIETLLKFNSELASSVDEYIESREGPGEV